MLHHFLLLYAVRLPSATTDADTWLNDMIVLVCRIQPYTVSLGDGRPDGSCLPRRALSVVQYKSDPLPFVLYLLLVLPV